MGAGGSEPVRYDKRVAAEWAARVAEEKAQWRL